MASSWARAGGCSRVSDAGWSSSCCPHRYHIGVSPVLQRATMYGFALRKIDGTIEMRVVYATED